MFFLCQIGKVGIYRKSGVIVFLTPFVYLPYVPITLGLHKQLGFLPNYFQLLAVPNKSIYTATESSIKKLLLSWLSAKYQRRIIKKYVPFLLFRSLKLNNGAILVKLSSIWILLMNNFAYHYVSIFHIVSEIGVGTLNALRVWWIAYLQIDQTIWRNYFHFYHLSLSTLW